MLIVYQGGGASHPARVHNFCGLDNIVTRLFTYFIFTIHSNDYWTRCSSAKFEIIRQLGAKEFLTICSAILPHYRGVTDWRKTLLYYSIALFTCFACGRAIEMHQWRGVRKLGLRRKTKLGNADTHRRVWVIGQLATLFAGLRLSSKPSHMQFYNFKPRCSSDNLSQSAAVT